MITDVRTGMLHHIGHCLSAAHLILIPGEDGAVFPAFLLPNLIDAEQGEIEDFQSPIMDAKKLQKYTLRACRSALIRHAGRSNKSISAGRDRAIIYGRDLSSVEAIAVTGGAILYGFPDGDGLDQLFQELPQNYLLPRNIRRFLVDQHYLLSSMGLIQEDFPGEACEMLMEIMLEKN